MAQRRAPITTSGWYVKPEAASSSGPPSSQDTCALQSTETAAPIDFGEWTIGGKCEALFKADGKYYEATISNLRPSAKGTRAIAEVIFRGFETDGPYAIKLSHIRKQRTWREKKDVDSIGLPGSPRRAKRTASIDGTNSASALAPSRSALRGAAAADSDASTGLESEDESDRRDRRFLLGRDDQRRERSRDADREGGKSGPGSSESRESRRLTAAPDTRATKRKAGDALASVDEFDDGGVVDGAGSTHSESGGHGRRIAPVEGGVVLKRRRYDTGRHGTLGAPVLKPDGHSHVGRGEGLAPNDSVGSGSGVSSAANQVDSGSRLRHAFSTNGDTSQRDITGEKPEFNVEPQGPKEPLVIKDATDSTLATVPASMNWHLRDYQRDGIRFLYRLYANGKGGILGDDMGLGKTVQVICFLAAVFGKTGHSVDEMRRPVDRRPVLIVAPTTLLANWKREFDTWGYFTIGTYHSSSKKMADVLGKASSGSLEIVLTTYETARNNLEALNSAANWRCVIADEAHRLKSPDTQTTREFMGIAIGSPRFGLTGTAVQNTLAEFWCLLNWANPDEFMSKDSFMEVIVKPIGHGQRYGAGLDAVFKGRQASIAFNRLTAWCFLRRTKKLIADQLPKKEDKVIFCPLTDIQKMVYRRTIELPQLQRFLDDTIELEESDKEYLLPCILWLQKISNHLLLMLPKFTDSPEIEAKQNALCDKIFVDCPQFRDRLEVMNKITMGDPTGCGKLQVLQKLLPKWKEDGSKVLIFSYSLQVLNVLESFLCANGYSYGRLDGEVQSKDRMAIVDEFNNGLGMFAFVLSTRVGSMGLNLTSANVCVIFDPNWNPALDLQAQDRAFRIGQLRNVTVFRLISAGSIEELVYARQIYKQQLSSIGMHGSVAERRYFDGVANDRRHQGELFGIKNLFSLNVNRLITQDIIQRTEETENMYAIANYELNVDATPAPQLDESVDKKNGEHFTGVASVLEGIVADSQERRSQGTASQPPQQERSNPATRPIGVQSTLSDILDECGVEYAHANEQVLEPSRMEADIGRIAALTMPEDPLRGLGKSGRGRGRGRGRPRKDSRAGGSVGPGQSSSPAHTGRPSVPALALQQHRPVHEERGGLGVLDAEDAGVRAVDGDGTSASPVNNERRAQFARMGASMGYSSLYEFAQRVSSCDAAERQQMLDTFYAWA